MAFLPFTAKSMYCLERKSFFLKQSLKNKLGVGSFLSSEYLQKQQ